MGDFLSSFSHLSRQCAPSLVALSGAAAPLSVVVTYAYDHRGRMVRKDIQRRDTETLSITYTWDNLNIVRETTTDLSTFQPFNLSTSSYVWGLDIDGTLQGAGGVGGLLGVIAPRPMGEGQQGEGGTIYMPCYDANGNVTEYVSTNGVVAAHYDYSPFGELIDAIDVFAMKFTHMFSSKPHCSITGLCEYQMRKYNPEDGHWVNRDPLGNDPRNMIAIAWSSVYENPNCKGHSISEFMPPTDEAKAEFVRKCVGDLTPKIEAFQ